jgi:cytochrome c-type biogenesis protein CcmH/NrfF
MNDWQTWVAPAVVILTVAVMIWRAKRKQKSPACDEDCGCGKGGE